MYSSLQKVDITTEVEGRRLFVQTDHRDAGEVAEEPELATIFALTRLINARKRDPNAIVRYACPETLHPAVARAVVAVGAEAEAMADRGLLDLSGVSRVSPDDLIDEAFAALAKTVLAREGLPLTEAGLLEIEKRLGVHDHEHAADDENEEGGEIAYWTQLAEIAAVVGELVRAKTGGRWVADTHDMSTIPFLFRTSDSGRLNVAGKTENFFEQGETHAPHFLFRVLEDEGRPQGPLLVCFKPAMWDAAATLTIPFDFAAADVEVPIIALGRDQPNSFAFCPKASAPASLDEMKREALANLAKERVDIKPVALDAFTFYLVHGSYYACEKLLDQQFMRKMHAELGTELLLAAVPEKGRLLLLDPQRSPNALADFILLARTLFDKDQTGRRICPTVFAVGEGKVTGVVKLESPPPPPAPPMKKGFFSRMFGRS